MLDFKYLTAFRNEGGSKTSVVMWSRPKCGTFYSLPVKIREETGEIYIYTEKSGIQVTGGLCAVFTLRSDANCSNTFGGLKGTQMCRKCVVDIYW